MVEEYTERNAVVLKCKPAQRKRQRKIQQTLQKLETFTPQPGQSKLEAAETKLKLRKDMMLPVLAKFSVLLKQVQTQKSKQAKVVENGEHNPSLGSTLHASRKQQPGTRKLNRDHKQFSPRRVLPPIT